MTSAPGPENQEPKLSTDPVEAATEPLGRSAALGTLWLTGQKWVVRVSGLVTIAVLTRLIAPEDFGVVAAASTIVPLILLLSDLGLSTYLVQAKEVESRTLSTAFWFSVIAGSALAAGLALTAPLIATALSIEESTSVLRAMSVPVLATVLASVPTALLRRQMQFRLLAIQATVGAFAGQVIAVIMAFRGAGAWALVAQMIVYQATSGALAWRAARWTPTREFSTTLFAAMARFGSKVMAVDLIATSRAVIEAAIISSTLGAVALGYLAIAQRLVQVVQDVGAAALMPVSTVVFAKVRESPERLRAGYLKALGIGYAAVTPMLTMVVVGAPLIIPLVFGPGWEPSVPVAQALAIAAILVLGAMIDHGLLYGVGRPGRWFAYALGIDGLTVATTAGLAPRGLVWVAGGFVVVALVATVTRWFVVGPLVGCPSLALAGRFVAAMVPLMVSLVAGIAVRVATDGLQPILSLALIGLVVVATHLAVVRLVSREVLVATIEVLPLPRRLTWLRHLT